MNGLGLDFDIMIWRAAPFFRIDGGSLGVHRSRMLGVRVRLYGDQRSFFYLSAARGELRCAQADFGGVGTGCDGGWHPAYSVFGGVEAGSSESDWSFFADAGPWLGARDDESLRTWAFAAGARYRMN